MAVEYYDAISPNLGSRFKHAAKEKLGLYFTVPKTIEKLSRDRLDSVAGRVALYQLFEWVSSRLFQFFVGDCLNASFLARIAGASGSGRFR